MDGRLGSRSFSINEVWRGAHTSQDGRILTAHMGKGVFAALAGLITVAITVVLLAGASTPAIKSSKCSSAHSGGRAGRFNKLVPPGNSSASEYVENVPTARGGCPSVALASAASASIIPESTTCTLLTRGRAGIATDALARATGPAGSSLNVPGLSGAVTNRKAAATSSAGSGGASSPLGAIADALDGSAGGGGLGVLVPVILILCVFGMGGTFLLRRRRKT